MKKFLEHRIRKGIICLIGLTLVQLLHLPAVRSDSDPTIDRLLREIAQSKADTHRLFLLNELIEQITEDTIWPVYNEQMGKLALTLTNTKTKSIQETARKYLADYNNNLAYLQQEIGNTERALTYYYRGLHIYEEIQNNYGIANTLNNIGTIYDEQGDKKQALQNYQRSFGLMNQLTDTFGMALSLNNMGSVYNSLGNLPLAIEYFKHCIVMREQIRDQEGLGITLSNLGGVYAKMDSTSMALEFYRQSMKIQEESGDAEGMALSFINFGSLYLKQKQYQSAERSFISAKEYGERIGNARVKLGAANWLSQLYASWGKFKPAYEMQVIYKQLTDSIRNDEARSQTLKKQIQFDFEKQEASLKASQEKKDVLAREELTRQKIIRNASIGAALVLVISGWLVLMFYKRKKEVEMEQKITDSRMRAINSQMNPHFIFNCMHSVQTLVARQDFLKADNCLVRFAKLIRKVLDHSTQKEISLDEDLETLQDYVELEKMRLDYPLDFQVHLAPGLEADNILIPPLLVQPIIENAIIHGIKPKKAAGQIVVSIKKMDQLLSIEISDNGVGRKTDVDSVSGRKSYGIPLTRERLVHLGKVQKMKSSYKITDIYSSNHEMAGTHVLLTLPLHAAFT